MIARVRRARELDGVTFFSTDGRALHVTTYGFTEDESRRAREELLRWLTASGIPLDADEGRPV